MGKPVRGSVRTSVTEYIGCGGQRGELTHLSNLRKRKQIVISEVAASETETAQTEYMVKPGRRCIFGVAGGDFVGAAGAGGKLQRSQIAEAGGNPHQRR